MMTPLAFTQWFEVWSKDIQTYKEYMSDLDNAIGDGDHGFNMAKGATFYHEARQAKQELSISEECKLLGMTLLSKVGGASGPLYGSALLAMAKAIQDAPEISHEQLVDALQAGVDSIMLRGKATRYEKTMIDVWIPVIEALRRQELTEELVDQFVNDTAPLKATKGRASYLGDRSIGHIDPGSFSSGLLFKSLLKVM
jgi:phosphoenolpyruvate---glycerone phosphotransferase subunit DhaL